MTTESGFWPQVSVGLPRPSSSQASLLRTCVGVLVTDSKVWGRGQREREISLRAQGWSREVVSGSGPG